MRSSLQRYFVKGCYGEGRETSMSHTGWFTQGVTVACCNQEDGGKPGTLEREIEMD